MIVESKRGQGSEPRALTGQGAREHQRAILGHRSKKPSSLFPTRILSFLARPTWKLSIISFFQDGIRMASTTLLHFNGHQYLRHRLVLSLLSGKPVRIDKIRPEDKNPGLRGELTFVSPCRQRKPISLFPDYEVSLLRLLERVTNGTIIEINVTGMSRSSSHHKFFTTVFQGLPYF